MEKAVCQHQAKDIDRRDYYLRVHTILYVCPKLGHELFRRYKRGMKKWSTIIDGLFCLCGLWSLKVLPRILICWVIGGKFHHVLFAIFCFFLAFFWIRFHFTSHIRFQCVPKFEILLLAGFLESNHRCQRGIQIAELTLFPWTSRSFESPWNIVSRFSEDTSEIFGIACTNANCHLLEEYWNINTYVCTTST